MSEIKIEGLTFKDIAAISAFLTIMTWAALGAFYHLPCNNTISDAQIAAFNQAADGIKKKGGK